MADSHSKNLGKELSVAAHQKRQAAFHSILLPTIFISAGERQKRVSVLPQKGAANQARASSLRATKHTHTMLQSVR
jgi:hypothetical protein